MEPSNPLRLISLNIEYTRHLDLVIPFLKKHQPDVFCLQELCERDISLFENLLDAKCIFSPITRLQLPEWNERRVGGVGIFSRFPVTASNAQYYVGNGEEILDFDSTSALTQRKTLNRPLLNAVINKRGAVFKICTTHFTWTPDGQADDFQREDIQQLLDILDQSGEFVLCGDFNAPRGREIFSLLATRYHDSVPAHYTTSIDGDLHRAGQLNYMVDGIFSTPGYAVSDVEMICGVSDHCALLGIIKRCPIIQLSLGD